MMRKKINIRRVAATGGFLITYLLSGITACSPTHSFDEAFSEYSNSLESMSATLESLEHSMSATLESFDDSVVLLEEATNELSELENDVEELENELSDRLNEVDNAYDTQLINAILNTEPQYFLSGPWGEFTEETYFIEKQDGTYISLSHKSFFDSDGKLKYDTCILYLNGNDVNTGEAMINRDCKFGLDIAYLPEMGRFDKIIKTNPSAREVLISRYEDGLKQLLDNLGN